VVRIVVPFRGAGAKERLAPLPEAQRRDLALAMLADVLAACTAVGRTTVVTDDERARTLAADQGADVLGDPGGGQGAAVEAGLHGRDPGALLVVNADVPCVVPRDLRALVRATPAGGLAYVPAKDGTTNALGLSAPQLFAPLYGPGSAARFHARATELGVEAIAVAIPNLADDVDDAADLDRISLRAGPRTQAAITALAA
jgi:2-phospho-L-lactate guanylyltransferase